MRRSKPFYGWWIALAGLIQLTITSGTAFYSFGIFYKPLIADFGWSRAEVSAVTSFYYLGDGLAIPFIGRWIDRNGPMRAMLAGALVAGFLFLLLSSINALWQLYVLFLLVAVCFDAMGAIPISLVMSRWYVRRRGSMSAVALAGMGMGGAVIAPLSAYLVVSFGWRTTFQVLGLMIWAVCLPLILFVFKPSPQELDLLPDGDGAPLRPSASRTGQRRAPRPTVDPSWPFDRVVRATAFWLIAITFLFGSTSAGGVLMHEFAFLTDQRMPYDVAAAAVGVTGFLSGAGKLIFGYLADHVAPRLLLACCFTLTAISLAVALFVPTHLGAWLFVTLYALGMGPMNSLRPLIVVQSFGLVSFGRALGLILTVSAVGYAVGPLLAGFLFDVLGSYSGAFATFLTLYVVSAGLILLAKVPAAHGSGAPAPVGPR